MSNTGAEEWPPVDDPSWQEHIKESMRYCSCCPLCSDPPCDGAMAGGVCDQAPCRCDDDWDEDEDYDREDDDDLR